MKRVIISFCFAVFALLSLSVKMQAAKSVSVFIEGNLSMIQEQIVDNAFMARLSSSVKEFSVYERNEAFIKAVTREHDFQTSGDVPESQIRKIAAKFGVDYVIVVSAMADENGIYMSARLIDIESGKVEKTVSQDRDKNDNKTLKNLSNNVAYRLINSQSK